MKTVLVTGACINTGVNIVERFATEGYKVIFTGRDPEKVNAAEKLYKEKFPESEIIGYPIASLLDSGEVDEESVEKMFAFLDEKGLFIDTLVLNAAHQGLGLDWQTSPLNDFVKVINTNVVWNFCLSRAAASRMKEQGGGSIVFVSSNTAHRPIPDRTAYISSKGGQLGLMRALAIDLGKYNIRVNAVLPGLIKTDRWEKNPEVYRKNPCRFTPLGDAALGEDVADAVYYIAAHAKHTTGAELLVDGGNSVQLFPVIPED